jgi:hypothetical protein
MHVRPSALSWLSPQLLPAPCWGMHRTLGTRAGGVGPPLSQGLRVERAGGGRVRVDWLSAHRRVLPRGESADASTGPRGWRGGRHLALALAARRPVSRFARLDTRDEGVHVVDERLAESFGCPQSDRLLGKPATSTRDAEAVTSGGSHRGYRYDPLPASPFPYTRHLPHTLTQRCMCGGDRTLWAMNRVLYGAHACTVRLCRATRLQVASRWPPLTHPSPRPAWCSAQHRADLNCHPAYPLHSHRTASVARIATG